MTRHRQIAHTSDRSRRVAAIALAINAVVVASARSPHATAAFQPVTDAMAPELKVGNERVLHVFAVN